MKVYSVLFNSYDYQRFTDYLGTYSSLEEAIKLTSGKRCYVVMEGEKYFDVYSEGDGASHYIIVIKEF